MWEYHGEVNRRNAEKLNLKADAVLIHDPQPAALVNFRKKGIWMWRCHIDVSGPEDGRMERPQAALRKVRCGRVLGGEVRARHAGRGVYHSAVHRSRERQEPRPLGQRDTGRGGTVPGIPGTGRCCCRSSRFDRFKDPIGVIKAYRMAKKYNDCVLVLAGSPASDDPEGEAVLNEVKEYASDDRDIFILLLPPFSDKDINALQRMATVVLRSRSREGSD